MLLGPQQYSTRQSRFEPFTSVDVELDTAVGKWNHRFPKPSETAEESAGFVAAAVTVVFAVETASVGILRCSVEVSQLPVKKFADLPNPTVN